jgi:hypothetical protein
MQNYLKFIKYLSTKFEKPFLFPEITEKRLIAQWENLFFDVQRLCKCNSLKELVESDNKYTNFKQRIDFYEHSCDITQSIGIYLNSPDIKNSMEENGPYMFKDLSAQDQLILVKLQYEGKIIELEEVIIKQKGEISMLKSNQNDQCKLTSVYK